MSGEAKKRYSALEQDRRPYLDRGRDCAKLTLPSLLPDESANSSTKYTTPEQSMGARGVNQVAAKLLMALFPPNAPYLKMEVDGMTAQQIAETEGAKDEIDMAFGQYVRRVMTDFEARALRSDLYEIFRHLVVTGNATLLVPQIGRCRVFRLDKYVCLRDPTGNLIEWVGKESIARSSLPEEVRNNLPEKNTESPTVSNGTQTEASGELVDLFTHVLLNEEGKYVVYQEVDGEIIPQTEGEYLPEELPFLVLRYNKVDGESYGRGLVEEYLGDLSHLESLTKDMREFVSIASRVIPLINPNGMLTPRDLTEAENGEPIIGSAADVSFLQIERYNDFRVAKETSDELKQSLAFAFLMNTAIQRKGERVTAEEIRYMARELEDTLGGTYSVLSVDLQLPLARVQIANLESVGALPELPKDITTPKVVTGMDALGRGNDLSNLMQFLQIVGQSPAGQDLKWDQIAIRVANGLNIETDGLLMTPEEKEEQARQQQMMQMMNTLGPNAVNQLGGLAQQQVQMENQDNG